MRREIAIVAFLISTLTVMVAWPCGAAEPASDAATHALTAAAAPKTSTRCADTPP